VCVCVRVCFPMPVPVSISVSVSMSVSLSVSVMVSHVHYHWVHTQIVCGGYVGGVHRCHRMRKYFTDKLACARLKFRDGRYRR